jgi:hypothetical protein
MLLLSFMLSAWADEPPPSVDDLFAGEVAAGVLRCRTVAEERTTTDVALLRTTSSFGPVPPKGTAMGSERLYVDGQLVASHVHRYLEPATPSFVVANTGNGPSPVSPGRPWTEAVTVTWKGAGRTVRTTWRCEQALLLPQP